MTLPTEIAVPRLSHLVGLPGAPAIADVRIDALCRWCREAGAGAGG